MAQIKEVREDLAFLSNVISEQTRTISLSMLAIVWLFLIGGENKPVLTSPPSHAMLISIGGLSLAALFLDYAQCVTGYINTKRLMDRAEEKGSTSVSFDTSGCLYCLRKMLFWGKQFVVVFAGVLLVVTISAALLSQ